MARNDVRVAVAGAGAFGGWTALALQRRGARVTLLDAWGPGHARASSGGETRVIRATYGSREHYTRMAARSLALWREHESRWRAGLLHETGVLWMFGESADADGFRHGSEAALAAAGLPFEALSQREAERRFPQVSFQDISRVLLEPEAGYLMARRACAHVVERLVAEGGHYRIAAAAPPPPGDGRLPHLHLRDGGVLEADAFVFACGPWLPSIFPDVIGARVTATRQEVHYFGPPPGDAAFTDAGLPVWIDFRETQVYGVPGDGRRGFKVADDTAGPAIDPTTADRAPTAASIDRARAFLALRFPRMAGAPLTATEVCQYESSPDADFILDRHPGFRNVWIAGGGSGHGFKMGPAIGEMLASAILDETGLDARYGLGRLASPPPGGWQPKWT